MADFIPFDPSCLARLTERFEYLFEQRLLDDICRHGQLRTFKEDDIIMDMGQTITHMPLVLDGSIKVMTEDKTGEELLLYYLESGDTCAVTLNCCTRKSVSTVRAISETACELYFIPVEKMEEWMIAYSSWRAYVMDSYNSRLHEMLTAIDNLVFNSMEDRIKNYLKDKMWVTKSEKLPVSHADIAKDLHSSRVVVSRIMKKLERAGLIKQQRLLVEVIDL